MLDAGSLSVLEMRDFLLGTTPVEFALGDRQSRYGLIQRVLEAQQYPGLRKAGRGLVRRYLQKVTGLQRAQIARLVRVWRERHGLEVQPVRRPRFARRYSREDIELLARIDEVHEGLSGAAVRRILQREYLVYGRAEFMRLAKISVSHLYNLRRSKTYKMRRIVVEPTEGQARPRWAERRRPEPRGEPGHLRVDTVHQGRQDGRPGPYHINAVDTVTQWEVVHCCRTLSESELAAAVRVPLDQFPFVVQGFHSDNGGEYVNKRVGGLLEQMRVEFTVSRPSRTTDNALVEGKNGAVVRRWMGWGLLGRESAPEAARFLRECLNPYLNFHRPCGFAQVEVDERGRRKRHYRAGDYCTPYEKLISLPDWQRYLKPGVTPEDLGRQALACSDTDAAKAVQAARDHLFAPELWSQPVDNTELMRGKGTGRPLAPHPHPSGNAERRRLTSLESSGSSRIGNTRRLQAHLWIRECWNRGDGKGVVVYLQWVGGGFWLCD
jgi:transposase InsO family protein